MDPKDQRKLTMFWDGIPIAGLVLIALLAGTNYFTELHKLVTKALKDLCAQVVPLAIKVNFAWLLIRVAIRLNRPAIKLGRCLTEYIREESPWRPLVEIALQPIYCLFVAFLVVGIVAEPVIAAMLHNWHVLGTGMLLVLNPLALDLFGGLWAFFRGLKVGQRIKLVGKETKIEGTLMKLRLDSSSFLTESGLSEVRNREFLANTITEQDPLPSRIVLPPGVDLTRMDEQDRVDSSSASEPPHSVLFSIKDRRSANSRKDQ